MKILALALLALTSLAQARELDATEALRRTLAPGVYEGVTPQAKQACTIFVMKVVDGLSVIAQTGDQRVVRRVNYGSVYRWNPGQRLFLSSLTQVAGDAREESVFRTLAINDHTQYAVVSVVRSINRTVTSKNEIECEINL